MKIGGDFIALSKQYRIYYGALLGVGSGLVYCVFQLVDKEPIALSQIAYRVVFFTLFWYFVSFLWMRKKLKKPMLDCVGPQETSFYGVAHQMIKTAEVRGVLFATEKQLNFVPEATNFIENPLSIDFDNIRQVEVYKFRGLFEMGIRIHTQGNRTFKFRVNEPQVWITSIQNKIKLQ
ncbi:MULTISPECIES: hypothetical protein [unclassified Myroides]|uniref:hypothetical protein n=1 Tax=unclassified Myroides TaxID=2642485 RepID=UPI003D2F958D